MPHAATLDANATDDTALAVLRDILRTHGRLAVPADGLSLDADLFAAGLDSLAIVNVMLGIEEAFDVELPDSLLSRATFSSLRSLEGAVARMRAEQAA